MYNLFLDYAPDVTNISCNTQGIVEDNMDKYAGKFYYTEYLGTEFTMAKSLGNDTWAVCKVMTQGNSSQAIAKFASDYLDTIPLTTGTVKAKFNSFTFGTDYDTMIIRGDGAVISGIAKVSTEPKDCTTPVTITQGKKEYQLYSTSSGKYTWYTYDGYTIMMATGIDLASYITFK